MVTEDLFLKGDIFSVASNPTRGHEIKKIRPFSVVMADEVDSHLRTYIVAPLTTGDHPYPFRVGCRFDGKGGQVFADQLWAVDKERLLKRLGTLTETTLNELLGILQAMFAVYRPG